ncbi:hypothetical protein BE18_05920 [Sorangium cellulosum]|uniref:Uncharacterized protein n=1 Tax=Sorangium cellulosum TaxID=56 RepID=A0A150SL44_SORCE|nr:hypothetical protein BE18_05920 [Sorangium cellulosum]
MAVTLEDVLLFCSRFNLVTRALTKRNRNKPPLELADEYDVQELAYAALKPLVADLTLEDPTPKVAGNSGRVDLVSHRLGLAIEAKATLKASREGGDIVEECFQRIKLYSSVRNIRVLAFFIHDPDEKIDDVDNVQRHLEGTQPSSDGGTFQVYVVGPRFEKTFRTYDPASSEPIDVKIGDVKYLPDVGGVLVSVNARGTGRTPVIPKLSLRVGNTKYELGTPPTAYQTGTPHAVYQPTDTDLIQRGDVTLYFGPSGAGGQEVALRSTGLLEVDVPGLARPIHVPFEISVPRREKVADQDALNELSSWFRMLDDIERTASITFAVVDQRLQLPDGTAKRLLAQAVAEDYEVARQGEDTIMFKFRPYRPPPSSRRWGGF